MFKIKLSAKSVATRPVAFLFLLSFFWACDSENQKVNPSEVSEKPVTLVNEAESDQEYVASVGTSGITKKKFKKEALILGGLSNIEDKEKAKLTLMQRLISEELLYNKGLSLNLHLDEDVQRTLKKLIVKKVKDGEWRTNLESMKVTEEEIKEYYEKNKESYQTPEMRRGAILSLKYKFGESEPRKKEKRTLITKIRKNASKNPESFADLVREHSDDRLTKNKGGLLNWLPKEAGVYSLPAEVVQRLFELEKVGQISPVIETDSGLFIVKLANVKTPETHSLSRVRFAVREKILTEKKQNWTDEYLQALKKEFPVKIDRAMLNSIQEETLAEKATSAPPSFPVGTPGNQ